MRRRLLGTLLLFLAAGCSREERGVAIPSLEIQSRRYGSGQYFATDLAVLNVDVIVQFSNMVQTATQREPYKQDPFCRMILQQASDRSQIYDFLPYWSRQGTVRYRLRHRSAGQSGKSMGTYSLPVERVQQWCTTAGISFEKFIVRSSSESPSGSAAPGIQDPP